MIPQDPQGRNPNERPMTSVAQAPQAWGGAPSSVPQPRWLAPHDPPMLTFPPPAASTRWGWGTKLLLVVLLLAAVGLVANAGSREHRSSGADAPAAAWRAERGDGWALEVPAVWARSNGEGSIGFDARGAPDLIDRYFFANVLWQPAQFALSLADLRTIIVSDRGGAAPVGERVVEVGGVTWIELRWPMGDMRRGALAWQRLWTIECGSTAGFQDGTESLCQRMFASVRLSPPAGYVVPRPPSPSAGPSASGPVELRVDGVWATTFETEGGHHTRTVVTLQQDGASLRGTYRTGRTAGTVVASLQGAEARGSWREGGLSGSFTWTFTSDGARFSGGWRGRDGSSGRWSGARRP